MDGLVFFAVDEAEVRAWVESQPWPSARRIEAVVPESSWHSARRSCLWDMFLLIPLGKETLADEVRSSDLRKNQHEAGPGHV